MQSHIGNHYGNWTVIGEPGTRMYRSDVGALCRCKCGTERLVALRLLKKGETKSCGCIAIINAAKKNTTHGQHKHRIYGIWRSMKERCHNPNHDAYNRYGGRGITVCLRWQKFENFLSDNASLFREGLSLDRKNNNGNYSPRNCEWVTKTAQSNNRHNNLFFSFSGSRLTCAQWARKLGVKEITLRKRYQAGWSVQNILTKPVRQRRSVPNIPIGRT